MSNQFHSLLASKTHESLLTNLNLPPAEEAELVDAAKEIRVAIIAGFSKLREEVKRNRLDYEVPKPKFAIQGSYIYGTLNAPANPPIQQVDIDLGMYLPFSALGDGQKPKTATEYYFSAVTRILNEHVQANRKTWNIPPVENQKDTCIRVILNQKTHIDIPLYAVPAGDFDRITEAQIAVCKSESLKPELNFDDAFSLEANTIDAVTPDVIYMAHRKGGWLPSDALVVRNWVKSHFRQMGAMIRPVNRFLKAWRDHVWPDGNGPSSIFLLAHSLRSFPADTNGLSHCDTLKIVIDALPEVFNHPLLIPCPTSDDKDAKEDLRERIDLDKREVFRNRFENLKSQYEKAKNTDPGNANRILITLFGERMPNAPSRIVVVNESDALASSISATAPEIRPLYTTDRSNSG